jgi:hypothetical protein
MPAIMEIRRPGPLLHTYFIAQRISFEHCSNKAARMF